MYRVLLADDEEIIREGVSRAVPWQTLGFTLDAVAEDGVQALKLVEKQRPDLVITDIRMPNMDGLDLIRALREQAPACKILILTGHGEFAYARAALQLGVYDFLLKPVELAALCGVLTRLREELDAQYSRQSELDQLHQQVQEERILQQQRLLRRYLAGRAQAEELVASLPERWCGNRLFCGGVLVQMDDFDRLTGDMDEQTVFSFTQELENVLIAQSNEEVRIVENDNGRYFLLFISEQEEELRFHIRSYVRRLRAAVAHTAYTTITSSVVQGGIGCCRQAYEETRRCLDRVFLLGTGQDIQADEALRQNFSTPLPEGIDMQRLTRTLSDFKKVTIHSGLAEIAESIRQTSHNSYLYTSMLVGFVYGEMIRLLTERQCPVQSVLADPMAAYSRLMACQSLDSMMSELMRILDTVCDFLEQNASVNQDAVERAKLYIQEHYSDSRLSLDMVASAVGISPTYLSALFKQNAGQSFVSFLTETRLKRAQYLLRVGDYRSYEVAYLCGYDNSTYFSTIFKRYVGVSPSEYRKVEANDP